MSGNIAPASISQARSDREQGQVGGPKGPNKGGPVSGAGSLGTELGAQGDARRDRAQAIAEGDILPPLQSGGNGPSADLGYGQLNGQDQGFRDPAEGHRGEFQQTRNEEFSKEQPDLRTIAATSGGSGAHHPTADQSTFVGSGARPPGELLETAHRSTGTDSGTGAASFGRGSGDVEISGGAPTSNTSL